MPDMNSFIDTNILLYLLSADSRKAEIAEQLMVAGGIISIQVLNEMTNVARRKCAMTWEQIAVFSATIQSFYRVESLTIDTYSLGLSLAQRYQLSVYDSMILAAASLADCNIIYTEDLQHGMIIDNKLRICNPFF